MYVHKKLRDGESHRQKIPVLKKIPADKLPRKFCKISDVMAEEIPRQVMFSFVIYRRNENYAAT